MAYPEPFQKVSHQRKRGIHLTVAIVVVVAATFVAGFFWAFTRERVLSPEELQANGALLFEKARKLPEFTLTNDLGEPVTADWFKGQWDIVFFGYTFCPDICPTTLALLKQYYDQLPVEQQGQTRIVLASVDPARDTTTQLNQYLAYFHPEFRGVSGEFLDVHRFATGLGAPFNKVPGGGDNYLVDHSGNVALINPAGHFVGILKAPISVEQINRVMPSFKALR
ncbi:SCO family protein [Litorivivens sp.]|uniref:SCO family protein n=1 Tax=Litorivivens sp. TaxID=2020868 RepID=UPI0035621A85